MKYTNRMEIDDTFGIRTKTKLVLFFKAPLSKSNFHIQHKHDK